MQANIARSKAILSNAFTVSSNIHATWCYPVGSLWTVNDGMSRFLSSMTNSRQTYSYPAPDHMWRYHEYVKPSSRSEFDNAKALDDVYTCLLVRATAWIFIKTSWIIRTACRDLEVDGWLDSWDLPAAPQFRPRLQPPTCSPFHPSNLFPPWPLISFYYTYLNSEGDKAIVVLLALSDLWCKFRVFKYASCIEQNNP